MTMRNASVFWFTGLSGAGKTTLSLGAKRELESSGLTVKIIDGDIIRESYKKKLGFGREDVKINNANIVEICKAERRNYDVLMVPVVSPIDEFRTMARKNLEPFFYLIYLSSSIESLKKRDPKDLYKKADRGEITDMIGYSSTNPYEVPEEPELLLDTSSPETLEPSIETIVNFIKKNSKPAILPS
jgi:adenylylsulfate kinase